ncbi:MAG: hypothetical protein KIH62_004645 [Candidatus Kerfeldbacteria bacterium]|nr:hypothetical protein [Candidatus Kerfeldbacteria bacterium]
MKNPHSSQFIKGVERLIRPADVTAISFLNTLTRRLPVQMQKKLMSNAAKDTPHMGFVVEPYAFFLCYPIIDIQRAQALIPDDYKIIKTKIFSDDEPNYYVLFGCFTAHTSAFWGSRIEMYVIAEHTKTKMLSWIIVDYDTNTNSFDPAHGLISGNCSDSVVTTRFDGRVVVDMKRDDGSRRLSVEADITQGKMNPLDQRLWLEGNLSIDYGKKLRDNATHSFGLTFHPEEVSYALRIPVDAVSIEHNDWHADIIASTPTQVACFPYAQHFVTDSVPQGKMIRNEAELRATVDAFGDMHNVRQFSAQPIKKQIVIGWLISTTLSTAAILFLIIHFIAAH